MRKTLFANVLIVSTLPLLYCGPAGALVGMHSLVALIVGGTENRTMAVALSAHYGWIRETMQKLSAP